MSDILIVEDDIALNNGIAISLQQDGFAFLQAFSVREARRMLKDNEADLILLDINLPDGSGLDLCREIRSTSAVPIIFLTANDLETDVVTGLSLGGDDYITKPFSLMVLRARVCAVLRRTVQAAAPERIAIDDFIFDFDEMRFYKSGRELILSKTEQKLLKILVINKGAVLPRSLLVDKIWTDGAEYVDENALSVVVNRLRSKLEDNPSKPDYIETVYGTGYMWAVKKDGSG